MSTPRNLLTLCGLICLFLAASVGAGETPPPIPTDGTICLRAEHPFQKEDLPWLPLSITIALKSGRPTVATAFATRLNSAGHAVDTSRLTLANGRLGGEIAVAFAWDEVSKEARSRKPSWKDGAVQVLQVDCPVSDLTGTATGSVSWVAPTVPWTGRTGKAGTVPARAWVDVPLDLAKPVHFEFVLASWSATGADIKTYSQNYDGMPGISTILIRGVAQGSKVSEVRCLIAPERFSMECADRVWTVQDSALTMDVSGLRGRLTIKAGDLQVKAPGENSIAAEVFGSQKAIMPPQVPVTLDISGALIGRRLVGSAEVTIAGASHRSGILGNVRSYPFALHADRTPRTWAFTRQADPALVEAAHQEALVPIRPGEPGKRDFWTEYARIGGVSFLYNDDQTFAMKDGQRLVQKWKTVMPYDEYRRTIGRGVTGCGDNLSCIAAPSFNVAPIPGATHYRMSVGTANDMGHPFPALTFESPLPWAALSPVWDKVEFKPNDDSRNRRWSLTVTGLDAAGTEVGKSVKIPFRPRASFQGPYHQPARTWRQSALMHGRWMRDNPRNIDMRQMYETFHLDRDASGDGQVWYITFSALYGAHIVSEMTDDAQERLDALAMMREVADSWMRDFQKNYLPDIYQGWVFDQHVYGNAWLDLFRITGDKKYADAARLLAERLAAKQMPNGNWTEVDPTGHMSHDPVTGLYFWHGKYASEWPSDIDPSSLLAFLGRLRLELKTDEFKTNEERCWRWLLDNSIARFDFRKHGPGESTNVKMPWATIPDYALHCFDYLALDLPGREKDVALMTDLLRWCEDRAVDWQRKEDPKLVYPRFVVGGGHNSFYQNGSHMRLALAYARLAAITGNPLHRAKAEALAGSIVVSQNPVTGQISDRFLTIDPALSGSGDGGNRGEFAGRALMRLAQLWEGLPPIGQRPAK